MGLGAGVVLWIHADTDIVTLGPAAAAAAPLSAGLERTVTPLPGGLGSGSQGSAAGVGTNPSTPTPVPLTPAAASDEVEDVVLNPDLFPGVLAQSLVRIVQGEHRALLQVVSLERRHRNPQHQISVSKSVLLRRPSHRHTHREKDSCTERHRDVHR
jgi:hypothetical protein